MDSFVLSFEEPTGLITELRLIRWPGWTCHQYRTGLVNKPNYQPVFLHVNWQCHCLARITDHEELNEIMNKKALLTRPRLKAIFLIVEYTD